MDTYKFPKKLLENLKSQNFPKINIIKTYDFSTLYTCTTIPHDKLKYSIFDTINSYFFNINGLRKFTHLFIGHLKYFVKNHSDWAHKLSEVDIKKDACVSDWPYLGSFFQHSVEIPICTNRAPLLADLFFIFIWSIIYSKISTREKETNRHLTDRRCIIN